MCHANSQISHCVNASHGRVGDVQPLRQRLPQCTYYVIQRDCRLTPDPDRDT